jgi:phenylacetate-CoA ligase
MRKVLAKRMVLRGKRNKYLDEVHQLEWASSEDLKVYQQKALRRVLTDASSHVPYYQTRVQGNRLEDFPILTRTQIQAFGHELIVKERVNKRTHTEATSGTTSEPMTFVTDHGYRERGVAMKLFFYEWANVELGEPFIKFWGTFPAKTWYGRMRNALSLWTRNTIIMNTFDLRASIMDGYVEEIRRRKPKIILAYAVSFYEFAKYLDRKNVRVKIPGSIMTSTAALTPLMRETVERVFECPVFDRYGSRELMDMACDCEYHQGLHVNPYLQYIEILDENDQPCPPGKTGRIVVTQLHNPVMPFIRYDT